MTFDLTDICEHGDLITLEDFTEMVKDGGLIDFDGHGYLAQKSTYCKSEMIVPSEVKTFHFPEWCTHILWFNR